jgi:hypothetical protein
MSDPDPDISEFLTPQRLDYLGGTIKGHPRSLVLLATYFTLQTL